MSEARRNSHEPGTLLRGEAVDLASRHRSGGDSARSGFPEDALICCGLECNPSDYRRRLVDSLLDADVDWDYLIGTVVDHGLGPLFFRSVIAERVQQCPRWVVQRLETVYKLNAARNRLIFQECEWLLSALAERRVKAILLKGAALAHSVYAESAMRVMYDIDLLVRTEDVPAAERVLFDLECRPVAHTPPPNHHLVPFRSPRNFLIEIHWDLVAHPNNFQIDRSRLWAEARSVSLGEVHTAILSPMDQVWHAAVHDAFQHGFHRGLQCVADIAAIAARFACELSYKSLRRRANLFSIWPHVEAVLKFGACLLGRPLWLRPAYQVQSHRVRRLVKRGPNSGRSPRWHNRIGTWMFPSLEVSPHSRFKSADLEYLLSLAALMSSLDGSEQITIGV